MQSSIGWEVTLAGLALGAALALMVAEGGAYMAAVMLLVTTVPATFIAVYTAARQWTPAIYASGFAVVAVIGFVTWIESAFVLLIPLIAALIGVPTSEPRWIRSLAAALFGFSLLIVTVDSL